MMDTYEGVRSEREKQKEQKPNIEICPHSIKSKSYKEQKPAWSEEDKKMLNLAIEWAETMSGQFSFVDMDSTDFRKIASFLKSLRPPKDCSGCSKHLEGYISGRGDAENKLLEMYGILLMPDGELRMKPRWKPSKEQMEALQRAIDACESEWVYQDDELRSLLNDLNEL